MADSCSLIYHVEAFVDTSRPSSEQVASIDAVAALVKKDVLTLEALVRELELYLTTTDNVIRARGILLLAEILVRLSLKPLDSVALSSLVGFFTSRMADWQALRGALIGCLALLRRKNSAGMVTGSEARMLAQSYFRNVQAQSLAVQDRKLCFEVLQCLLDVHPDTVTMLGDDLVYGICDAIDGEKDPRCLMLTFHLVETLVRLFPDPSGSVASFAGDIFEILGCYFPIYFTHQRNDDFEIKRDDLSRALMHVFSSTPYFEPFAIPLLLEKLSSSLSLAKLDSLKYLNNCMPLYGVDRMIKHAKPIWNALKDVIFNFSPGILFPSITELEEDVGSLDIEIVKETLLCLQTATALLSSSNNLFLNLIIEDEDIETIFQSVTGEGSKLDTTKESQHQLCALGSVLSNSSKVSIDCCNRICQRYFPHLMDVLGVVKNNSSNIEKYKTFSGRLNFGALYLCVELFASCRDLVVAAQDLSPQLVSVEDNWWYLLQNYSTPFTYVLGSALEMSGSSVMINGNTGIEDIYCRVKGLQVLSTFPGYHSPILDDVYEYILVLLMSVITDRSSGDTHLWKLSLKALVKIGSSIEEFQDSKKKISYGKIVVERIVSLLLLADSSLSLPLKLEVISEIGTSGLDFMLTVIQGLEGAIFANFSEAIVEGNLRSSQSLISLLECYSSKVLPWCQTSGKFDDIAVRFVVSIWNQIESITAVRTAYQKQGLLDTIMMTVKLAVVGCTGESQSLIVQKAYAFFSSSLSFLPSELEGLQFAPDMASLSAKDTLLIYLFAAVLIGLRPQTYIPDVKTLLVLFTFSLVRGHVPSAQALASIINKWPAEIHKTSMSSACSLEEAIGVIFEMCLSNVCCSSHFKYSFSSNECSLTPNDSGFNEIHTVVGLAWVGKGVLMRGHEKVKDIAMLFLKYILSNQDMKVTPLEPDDSGIISEQDKYSLVARSAADAFHILLSDSEDCLNKRFHAVIRPLYKQQFFSSMLPILLSSIKGSELLTTRALLYRAFGHLISDTPMGAIVVEAKKVIPSLLDSFSALSSDILDKDLIYNLLLVLSGLLMDENGKEAIMEHVRTIISHLVKLVSYPHMMIVRETAIQCLVAMSGLPYTRIYPMRLQVLQAVSRALDDRKRAVRQEAARCRHGINCIKKYSLLKAVKPDFSLVRAFLSNIVNWLHLQGWKQL